MQGMPLLPVPSALRGGCTAALPMQNMPPPMDRWLTHHCNREDGFEGADEVEPWDGPDDGHHNTQMKQCEKNVQKDVQTISYPGRT